MLDFLGVCQDHIGSNLFCIVFKKILIYNDFDREGQGNSKIDFDRGFRAGPLAPGVTVYDYPYTPCQVLTHEHIENCHNYHSKGTSSFQ